MKKINLNKNIQNVTDDYNYNFPHLSLLKKVNVLARTSLKACFSGLQSRYFFLQRLLLMPHFSHVLHRGRSSTGCSFKISGVTQ